ncbi:MAG: hypothetical protein EAZ95_06065 [Bacteroidetes bacterium]|nr:MAG: hypothetical protein EAZ95_06065 [Bacteroidota bacterium]
MLPICSLTVQAEAIRVFAVADFQARVALSEAELHAEVEANNDSIFSPALQGQYRGLQHLQASFF